jgi:hypothetical protein
MAVFISGLRPAGAKPVAWDTASESGEDRNRSVNGVRHAAKNALIVAMQANGSAGGFTNALLK